MMNVHVVTSCDQSAAILGWSTEPLYLSVKGKLLLFQARVTLNCAFSGEDSKVKQISVGSTAILFILAIAMGACGGGSGGSVKPPGTGKWQRVTTPFNDPSFIDFG